MRILYIRKSLKVNGPTSLIGRKLCEALESDAETFRLADLVSDNDPAPKSSDGPRVDAVGPSELAALDPDVVYVEGGMFASEKMWKVPEQTLELLAARGAVIILADNAANEVRSQVPAYRAASRVLRASIAFDAENEPIEILDPVHNSKEGSDRQVVCDPTEMVVAPWLSPVYQGVRELFAGNPVVLKSWLHALASGHRRTAEITVTRFGPQLSFAEKRVPPFASIAQIGNGYLAFIAAHTSHDWMLDHYPDNLRWHLNLIRFLRGESQRSRRQQEGTGIVFLSHQLLVTAPIDAARALLDLPR